MSFSQAVDPQSIGASSNVDSGSVDMRGWDGVLFILGVGAIDGTQDMKLQDSADNSTFADIGTGFNITQVAGTGDNKLYMLDLWKPAKRYIRVNVANGAGATADFQAVIACQYRRTGLTPIAQLADVGELVKKQQ